jgi:acylphosphatase
MNVQYQIRVYGRVQGVGFRYAARNQARSLHLKGWVKNHPDGSVYSVIKGESDACMKYMDWCRRGTGYSWVERVEMDEMEPEELSSFSVRY